MKRLAFFAVALLVSVPALPQLVNEALDQRGDPADLRFLRDLRFQPGLISAIVSDVKTLPPSEARRSVLNRLRNDQASVGALPDSVLAAVLSPQVSLTQSLDALREAARKIGPVQANPTLALALPDADVLRIERLRQQQYLLRGYTSSEKIPLGEPASTATASDALVSPEKDPLSVPSGIVASERSTPQMLRTYTAVKHLTAAQCASSAEAERAKPCLYSGAPDCPAYDPTRFAGVTQIAFATSGVCTGTLVAAGWILTAAHCFLGPSFGTAGISTADELAAKNARGPDFGKYASFRPSYLFAGNQVSVKFQAYPYSSSHKILAVVTHPDYRPSEFDIPPKGPLHDVALVQFEPSEFIDNQLSKDDVKPASIPPTPYSGGVTLLGYGIAENAPGGAEEVNLTWPEADVVAVDGRLLIQKPTVRTFCSGDSGGPAFAHFQRGCPAPPEDNPLELVGVISYHDPVTGTNEKDPGKICQISSVSGFTDLGSPNIRAFLCGVTGDAIAGCR